MFLDNNVLASGHGLEQIDRMGGEPVWVDFNQGLDARLITPEAAKLLLKLLNNAVELLRTRHKNGEAYYWILYYTFLSPQQLENVDEIIEQLQPHIRDISRTTYYRKHEQAVETLSSILWGYTSKDCMVLLTDFFPTIEEGF